MESNEPELAALFRTAAAHALEMAMDDSMEAHIILDLAQHQFHKMFGAQTSWPERSVLN